MKNIVESLKTALQVSARYNDGVQKGFNPIDVPTYRRYNRFRPDGAKKLFCYLPFNSLTFSFGGQVFVCSYNRDIELGKYPQHSIDEIWNGKEAQTLREHMRYNDLDYGCRHCKFFFEKEKFSNLRPLVFDKYYKNTGAEFPQVFEFELSNECNLECQMCHGEVSSSIRKNRDKLPPLPTPYDDNFVLQLEKYIPHLKEAKFYGGEPFLIPIYYKIWDSIKVLNPNLELFAITNGSHWNKKIESIVTELNFDIAVSIDAIDRQKLETIRKNIVYDKLMENIKRFSSICSQKKKHLSLSFTVQKDNWEQLPLVINLCNEVDAYIYVSYLERPSHFSIADLPKDELKMIRDKMDKVSLPRFTQKERHNDNCFKDFKSYLDKYIANDEEKRYIDYDFQGFETVSDTSKADDKVKQIQKNKFATQQEFELYVENNYSGYSGWEEKLTQIEFLFKIQQALSLFTEQEKRLIRGLMVQTTFDIVIDSVRTSTVNELEDNCRKTLRQIAEYKYD